MKYMEACNHDTLATICGCSIDVVRACLIVIYNGGYEVLWYFGGILP